jgi:uncharacterized OB-fold protein
MTSPPSPRSAGSARFSGGPSLPDYLPPEDELTAPWWDATRERRLLLQTCGTCGARQHHPRFVCTTCGAIEELGWAECEGSGAVDTFTVVHRAPRPGVEVPYVIARVRLDDGPVLLSRLVDLPAPDGVRIGDRVRLRWNELSDGRALPVFALEERS